jgi:hypothetical protein
MLMKAFLNVPQLKKNDSLKVVLENTVLHILHIIEGNGLLPNTEFDPQSKNPYACTYSINFCNGQPGAIPMLVLAGKLFP